RARASARRRRGRGPNRGLRRIRAARFQRREEPPRRGNVAAFARTRAVPAVLNPIDRWIAPPRSGERGYDQHALPFGIHFAPFPPLTGQSSRDESSDLFLPFPGSNSSSKRNGVRG